MFLNKIKKNKKGFTIIEMMIAIAIFSVVIIYGMQALLNANFVHKKSQDMRSLMDSLTFALDDMSKNIRVGYNYNCLQTDFSSVMSSNSGNDCSDGMGISFEQTNGDPNNSNDQWVYFIGDDSLWKNTGAPYNSISNNVQMISEKIKLDMTKSGFSVIGAKTFADGDKQQPFVLIRLVGTIKDTPFSIETAVSQRSTIDSVIPFVSSDTGADIIPGSDAISRDQHQLLEAATQDAQQVLLGP
jgi:prepilin-type N-terminal cleavage/methylation domain-containing protein